MFLRAAIRPTVLWSLSLVTLVWVAPARGQEVNATELIQKVWQRYREPGNLELRVSRRSVQLTFAEEAGGAHRVGRVDRHTVSFTWWAPADCLIISDEGDALGGANARRRLEALKLTRGEEGRSFVVNPKSKGILQDSFPGSIFFSQTQGVLGELLMDPVLASGIASRLGPNYFAGDASRLKVVGEETRGGTRLLRLDAGGRGAMTRTSYWVDPEKLVLVRSLVTKNGQNPFGRMPSGQVIETVYESDFGKKLSAKDMDVFDRLRALGEGAPVDGNFGSVEELVGWLREGADAARQGPPGTVAGPAAPPPPAATAPTAVERPAEVQELSPEQMQAIVLIEGSDGVGTGFVARIREVDFVVTNQHVIGGNERLRVTTLGGVTLQVGAIFGAVGRDIALLRIEGSHAGPALTLAEDPVRTVRLGDKVVVVGNRRGGGVATQVSGEVRGIGPDKIEVDAPFEPGNSGSPILHLASGTVVGLATYSQTRTLDDLDGAPDGLTAAPSGLRGAKTEQRWFGYRADGVVKWEAIDSAKWRAQAKRISDFESDSDAIYHAMNGRLKEAYGSPRVRVLIERFEQRTARGRDSQSLVMQEVHELFRGLRALADSGVKDLKEGEFYDHFRSSLYWETSIPEQLRAREMLARRLDTASDNATGFLARLRR